MLERIRPRIPPPSFRCRTSRAAAALPISCWLIRRKTHDIADLAREVGTSARTLSPAVFGGNTVEFQELVPARAVSPLQSKGCRCIRACRVKQLGRGLVMQVSGFRMRSAR